MKDIFKRFAKVSPVAGLDGVFVRSVSFAELDKVKAFADGQPEAERDTASALMLVALGACDSDGNRLFADGDVDDVRQLPAAVVGTLANAVAETNRLNPDPKA